MPEIKNAFTRGKMNKDLDERLIPNGEYRDAMNVQVSTSEGADVGTVQNILGNTRVENIVPDGGAFKCIGSVIDEKNNKLYWFVTSDNVDAIIEHRKGYESAPVIVDTKAGTANAVLKFTDKIITGINIVDSMLFWTDNTNEPRKINIERGKLGTQTGSIDSSVAVHTKLVVNDEILKDYFTASVTVGTTSQNIDVSDASNLEVGMSLDSIAGVAQSSVTIDAITGNSISFNTQVVVASADELIFSKPIDITEEHITVIKKKPSKAPSVKVNTGTDLPKPSLFEKTFLRFSCRYKYADGEYSAFGPFTDIIFDASYTEKYDVDTAFSVKEPYNAAMVNNIESIELTDFVSPDMPLDVVQIDILYKQEDSPIVYSMTSIKSNDPEWSEDGSNQDTSYNSKYKGKYILKSENIYAALPENQTLRPWDNVPKKALSQEITGSRLIYGNYTQNYNIGKDTLGDIIKPGLDINYNIRNHVSDFKDGGLPSLKSQRNYQLGVVFGDEYGRETPVYTSTNAAVKIPWEDRRFGKTASNSLQLTTNLTSQVPSWASYYKFYIKETSGEYYNLVMDKVYVPTIDINESESHNHIWISFPSSDRNKLTEENHLILKKKIGTGEVQVETENRFRILEIKNEAPDSIKYKYVSLGSVKNTEGTDTNRLTTIQTEYTLFPSSSYRIDEQTNYIEVNRDVWQNDFKNGPLMVGTVFDPWNEHVYVSWEKKTGDTVEGSKRYRVMAMPYVHSYKDVVESKDQDYKMTLEETISEKDALIAYDDGTDLHDDLTFKVERKVEKDMDEFSGRFFVKIASDDNTGSTIEHGVTTELLDDYVASVQQNSYWFVDEYTNTQTYTSGIINPTWQWTMPTNDNDSITGVDTLANTEAEWDALITSIGANANIFIIDNSHFAAGQNSLNNYAKNAGNIMRGTTDQYPVVQWTDKLYPQVSGSPAVTSIIASQVNANGYRWWPFDKNYGSSGVLTSLVIPHTDTIITNQDENYAVNGLEGIITTQTAHTNSDNDGYRTWRQEGDLATVGDSDAQYSFDTTYGEPGETGRHFIHLSFLAPGDDLVDDTIDIDGNAYLKGKNSLAKHLQGIWGGGVFCKTDGSDFGNSDERIIEMEGNYDNNNEPQADTPAPGVGKGYNENYALKHDNQWNPSYPASRDPKGEVRDFVANINVGNKFKFSGDSTNTIYTILSKSIKKLYNHTPWRRRKIYDGTNWVYGGDSVEEAAVTWGASANGSGKPDDDATATGTPAADLQTKIKDFGKANNRRICYIIEVDKDPKSETYKPIDGSTLDVGASTKIQFIETDPASLAGRASKNPAIWETEHGKPTDLDIYYEASDNIPAKINEINAEVFAPVGCKVEFIDIPEARNGQTNIVGDVNLESWDGLNIHELVSFTLNPGFNIKDAAGSDIDYRGRQLRFFKKDGSYVTAAVYPTDDDGTYVTQFHVISVADPDFDIGLSWYNCFSFGNGIESDRIRDEFNQMQILNGAKASTTTEEPYEEETRKHGLIYSGIYNSNSGINNLNQFVMAEKITKELNPTFGEIQKLFQRRTSLVAFCEDRVISILSNRDALFNADGNPQLISSSAVLGDATPFIGDYGISKNPESFAKETYRAYFADKQRGAILRLSNDGITPISDAGMHDWFRDNLPDAGSVIGTYDEYKKDYNLTLTDPVSENLLVNASIDDGEPVVGGVAAGTILQNGPLTNGNSFMLPAITQEDNTSSFWMDINNEQLNTETTIINYPELLPGAIQPYVPYVAPVIGVTAQDTEFEVLGVYSGKRIVNYNFVQSSSTFDPFANDTHGTPQASVGRTHRYPNTALQGSGNTSNTSISGSHVYRKQNEGNMFHNWKTNADGNGNGNSGNTTKLGIVWWHDGTVSEDYDAAPNNNPQLLDTGGSGINLTNTTYCTFPGAYNAAFDVTTSADSVYNGTTVLNNTWYDAIGNVFEPKQNTIFNGEEIQIEFGVFTPDPDGIISDNTAWDDDADEGIRSGFFVVLEDGATGAQVPNSVLIDPATGSNPFQETANTPHSASFTHGINVQDGWSTNSKHVFSRLPRKDTIRVHYVNYKFYDATLGDNEGVVVEDLKVNLAFYTGSKSKQSVHILRWFQIRKILQMKTSAVAAVTPVTEVQEVLQVPSTTIPAWTSVNHNLVDWNLSGTNFTQHSAAVGLYGNETATGTPTSYYIQNADPSQAPVSVTAGSSQLIIPPGLTYDAGNGSPNSGSLSGTAPASQNLSDGVYTTDDKIIIDSAGSTVSLTQDISNSTWQSDNWYLIDIAYDTAPSDYGQSGGSSIIAYAVLDAAAVADTTPANYIGTVREDLSGVKSIELQAGVSRIADQYTDSDATPETVYRAIFKTPTNLQNSLSTDVLELKFDNFVGEIKKVTLINISETSTTGQITDWVADSQGLNHVHSLSSPTAFFKNGKYNWVSAKDTLSLKQSFSPSIGTEATATSNGGWELRFSVTEAVNEYGTPVTPISGKLEGYVTSAHDGTSWRGFKFAGIQDTGNYIITSNFDGTGGYGPQGAALPMSIKKDGVDYSSTGSILDYTGTDIPTSDQIKFNPTSVADFTGAINNIVLINKTNFISGGTAYAWEFEGFDTGIYDFIQFNDTNLNIQFNDAPRFLPGAVIDDTVRLQQYIPQVISVNEKYKIQFKHNITNNKAIGYYYYNNNGEGFEHIVYGNGALTNHSAEHVIGDATHSGNKQKNTFVIFVETNTVTGTLDDISMQQVFDYEPTTVTYNENVKGWVSFKSFLPEQGVSLAKKYYTMKDGELWEHHNENEERNLFYGIRLSGGKDNSTLTAVLNAQPSTIKIYNTLNYEGTQSQVQEYSSKTEYGYTVSTANTHNLQSGGKDGWYVDYIQTDKQEGTIKEFIEKEGKWFNYIRGNENDIKTSDFSFQGIGIINQINNV